MLNHKYALLLLTFAVIGEARAQDAAPMLPSNPCNMLISRPGFVGDTRFTIARLADRTTTPHTRIKAITRGHGNVIFPVLILPPGTYTTQETREFNILIRGWNASIVKRHTRTPGATSDFSRSIKNGGSDPLILTYQTDNLREYTLFQRGDVLTFAPSQTHTGSITQLCAKPGKQNQTEPPPARTQMMTSAPPGYHPPTSCYQRLGARGSFTGESVLYQGTELARCWTFDRAIAEKQPHLIRISISPRCPLRHKGKCLDFPELRGPGGGTPLQPPKKIRRREPVPLLRSSDGTGESIN